MQTVNTGSLLLLVLLMGYPLFGFALSSDREQAINIEADNLNIDDNRNISVYQGNVKMQQGSLHIKAEKIIFHFSTEKELDSLEISGNPATFNQMTDNNEAVSGSARKIIYSDNQLLLKLSGKANFQSDKDTIESEWITMSKTNSSRLPVLTVCKDRVRMLIQPKNALGKQKDKK